MATHAWAVRQIKARTGTVRVFSIELHVSHDVQFALSQVDEVEKLI